MKPEELRIGNWYQSVKWKQPVQLELSDLVELYHRCDGAELDEEIIAEMFEPIPITEEWLIKFGFEKIKNEYYTINDIISFIIDLKICYILIDNKLEIEIKYIHQLQNLYFALTGKELEIK